MSKFKVAINYGHGGSDPGAVANGLREKDLTKAIGQRVTKLLRDNYDISVKEIRQTKSGGSELSKIANEANAWGADLFVSIHINAGGGTGFESFIYNGAVSDDTRKLQQAIHSEVLKQIDVRNRGMKRANFAVVRQTRMPAVLTENLFIDTKADADKLKDSAFLDSLALGHANGIVSFLGLKKISGGRKTAASKSVNSSKSSAPTKTTTPKSTGKGDMKTNSIVVYLQSIGEPYSLAHRKKLASKYGINNYTGTAAQNTRLLSIIRGSTASSKSSNTKPSSKPKTSTTASIKRMADEVIAGKHGSGHVNRRKSLGVNQATYEKVRAEVNRRAGVKAAPKGKSVSQMASEVIAGKHGNGHANRRRSLGVNQATYNKVRAEVNRRS